MIAFRNFGLRRGGRQLLHNVEVTLHEGWRVGVTGRNGCGKSSLFAAVLGQLDPDQGDIERPRNQRVAWVAQETPALPDAAIDFVLGGDAQAAQALAEAERAEAVHDHEAAAKAHQRIDELGAYDARARAGKLLHGLGFKAATHRHPVAAFSGGWRARLNLGRALMAPSDVLLLDEPTNHLDLDAVVWLEEWLRKYQGMLLLISHDRDFLDGVATHVLHLADGAATLYSGNYSQYERQRAEALRQQQIAFEKEQAERAHLQAFIDRFKAKASKAKQAQSRVKRLEKLKGTAAARTERPFVCEFPKPDRSPTSMLKLVDVDAGYLPDAPHTTDDGAAIVEASAAAEPRRILEQVVFGLDCGERIGLLGPNGEGKSTLVKTVAGRLPVLAGKRVAHKDMVIGYFAQHTVDQLNDAQSPLEHFLELDPRAGEQALRGYLGRWNFAGERVFEKVAGFSGGERARLALALISWRKPNLLLLDEPTNHLDLEMREALAEALNDFEGALVLVSHDRSLLGLVCDSFWRVSDGRVAPFDGDLDDYARWLKARRSDGGERAPLKESAPAPKNEPVDRRRPSPREREHDKALRKQLRVLEERLTALAKERQALEARLGDPNAYAHMGTEEFVAVNQQRDRVLGEQSRLEEEWLNTSAQLEAHSQAGN